MTAPTIATARVAITPVLDDDAIRGLAASIKDAVARELRALADELSSEKDASGERYVLVKDRTGDYGIRDTETGHISDYMARPGGASWRSLSTDLRDLNAGRLRPNDASKQPFLPEGVLFPPYEEVVVR